MATLAAVALTTVACGRFQAKTPVSPTVLDMPPPPARLLIPVELPPPVPELPVTAELPPPPPAPSRPRESGTRPAVQPAATPATPPADVEPAPVLQTTPQTGPLEQKIVSLLAQAERNLGNVNYRQLSGGERQQYDQARGWIRNAHDALKARNYMYAEQLANKAAQLASLLARS